MFDTAIQFLIVTAVAVTGIFTVGSIALIAGVIIYRPGRGRRRAR